jgi:hypothetical protein
MKIPITYRNKTTDPLAKEATQNHYVTYSKKCYKKGDPGRK